MKLNLKKKDYFWWSVLSKARSVLIVLGAIFSILGTFVFAIYGSGGYVGSGIGFIMNAFVGNLPPSMGPSFITDANYWAVNIGIDVVLFYVVLVVFFIFIIAGFLQLTGLKSRIVGVIFSLFPLGVGVMFLLLSFTDILGPISGSLGDMFAGEPVGGYLPYLIDLGTFLPPYTGVGFGSFFLVGGGLLGLIGSVISKDY